MARENTRHKVTYKTPSGITLESSRRRFFASRMKGSFKKKQWGMRKVPNLSLIKRGDILLTVNQRHTPAGLKSRIVAKLGKGPYAHTATYLGKENNLHQIRDFDFLKGGKTYPMRKLTTIGVDYRVLRWTGAGGKILEKQIEAFVKNVEATTGRYDNAQLLLYSIYQSVKSEGAKKILKKHLDQLKKWLDDPKRFTCSEVQAEGGDPYQKLIDEGKRTAVIPPLKAHPTLDKELVTPAVINAGVEAGLLKHITACEWKYS